VQYSIKEIAKITKGQLVQSGVQSAVSHLLLDSRKLIYPAATLFIPIVTANRDAHQFIAELYAKGVRAFLTGRPVAVASFPEASFIQVADPLQALQALAAFHRHKFHIPVVGVTGSNGKTVVKEWLYQLLRQDYDIVRSPKSYNSQTGVPLSVWQMEPSHTLGIFEAGISQPGEMSRLEKIIQPTVGIFTNIGDAHNEGFLNILQKIREKLVLFTGVQTLIYCKDYPDLHESILQFHEVMRRKEQSNGKPLHLFAWSAKTPAELQVTGVEKAVRRPGRDKNDTLTRIDALYQGNKISIHIPFADEGSIENAIHCWCLMLWLGAAAAEETDARMRELAPVAMRLELKEAAGDCSLINDSYNSDLGSLSIALDFLAQQKQHPVKTLILSDILQSGRSEAALYESVAGLLLQKGVNRLVGIGRNISREKDVFLKAGALFCAFYASTDDFIRAFLSGEGEGDGLSFHDETILLKGARVFEFERISRLLEEKTHQTVLEIDLNALAHNLKVYREVLKPGVKVMAMVKAFSYGSGSYEIANLLQFHKVDYLAVAYADEGVMLRKRGITLPVMVMNPEPGTFDQIIRWRLEPEIYSPGLLTAFAEEAAILKTDDYPVHIKLDTGMHRLGFSADDVPGLLLRLKETTSLKVVSVFSHLAGSEDPALESFTLEQGGRFARMTEEIAAGLPYPFIRHLANSSAVARYPQLQFDMVRIGIGLHGIDDTGMLQDKLQPVSTLRTTISQLRTVAAGETVGYGRKGVADAEKLVATVAIGYADGYMRSLGNGKGRMLVRGREAPVIGNVCMDMLMLDVTDIPGVREGDTVTVFGASPTLQQVAASAGTISYEMMTGISGRVKRVYLQE
jgi:alanine racemase